MSKVAWCPRWLGGHGGLVATVAWWPRWPGVHGGLVSTVAWWPRWLGVHGGLVSTAAHDAARAAPRTAAPTQSAPERACVPRADRGATGVCTLLEAPLVVEGPPAARGGAFMAVRYNPFEVVLSRLTR